VSKYIFPAKNSATTEIFFVLHCKEEYILPVPTRFLDQPFTN